MMTLLAWPGASLAQGGDPEASPDPSLEAPRGEDEVEQGPNLDPDEEPEDLDAGRWYLGGFYRHTFTSAFLMKPFLAEVTSTNNPGAGFEATYSRAHLDIGITGTWQRYYTYGPFLAEGDPQVDTEMIDSSLQMAAAGVNFLWTSEISEKFAFQYGLDFAVGYLFGELRRTEAYRDSAGGWAPCAGVGDPDATYCEGPSVPDGETGGHYDVATRRWTEGGSLPNVWVRFAPHLALRYTPTERLRFRVDGGFDFFSGFFVGGALAVGL